MVSPYKIRKCFDSVSIPNMILLCYNASTNEINKITNP